MLDRRRAIGLLGLGAFCTGLAGSQDSEPRAQRPIAYPRSLRFRGLQWLSAPSRYPGTGSDMHWWAWGADDALYLVDDDGRNFDGPEGPKHLLRVTGTPPGHRVEEITTFPELAIPGPEFTLEGKRRVFNDEFNRRNSRYVCGALALDKRLFVSVYDYDVEAPGYPRPFVDRISPHAGIVAIMFSDDWGRSWRNVPSKDRPNPAAPYFLGPNFAGLAFVGFGPGYTGVPKKLGEFVYAISNDRDWATGDNVFLARVPRERVLERPAWQFFAGSAGKPGWSPRETEARPILRDPCHCGHPDMSYNAAQDRFLLSVFSDVEPHRLSTPVEVANRTWDRQTELQIYEGPYPWGPWSLVHNDPAWEYPHIPYLPKLPSKWWSRDGLEGVMLFSGDYTGVAQERALPSYYGLMSRRFALVR